MKPAFNYVKFQRLRHSLNISLIYKISFNFHFIQRSTASSPPARRCENALQFYFYSIFAQRHQKTESGKQQRVQNSTWLRVIQFSPSLPPLPWQALFKKIIFLHNLTCRTSGAVGSSASELVRHSAGSVCHFLAATSMLLWQPSHWPLKVCH